MEKKRIKIAILSISSIILIWLTASAILADVQAHFPGVDQSLIQMVLTIPSLFGLIFAFASGPISMKIPKKTIAIFALTSGLTGGMVALFGGTASIGVLLFSSVLIGIAQGIITTMSMALIAHYYTGKECSAMMGLQSAFANGGSMVLLFISGILAGVQWNYSYLVYLAFIPVIFITMKYLPKDQPTLNGEEQHIEKIGKLNGTVYFTALVMFLFGVFSFVFQTNIALLVVTKGFGNATTSGFINTAISAAGMVTGILFGGLLRTLKSLTIPVALFVQGIGMVLVFTIGTLPALFIAAICLGIGLSTVMPAGTFIASNAVSPLMRATAIAIITAAVNLGIFVSPIIMNVLADTFAGGSLIFKFTISAIGLFMLALLTLIVNNLMVKKNCNNN